MKTLVTRRHTMRLFLRALVAGAGGALFVACGDGTLDEGSSSDGPVLETPLGRFQAFLRIRNGPHARTVRSVTELYFDIRTASGHFEHSVVGKRVDTLVMLEQHRPRHNPDQYSATGQWLFVVNDDHLPMDPNSHIDSEVVPADGTVTWFLRV